MLAHNGSGVDLHIDPLSVSIRQIRKRGLAVRQARRCSGRQARFARRTLESKIGAHRDHVTLGTRERRIRHDAAILVLPCECHISPNIVAEHDIRQPGIIQPRTIDIFGSRVAKRSNCFPLR